MSEAQGAPVLGIVGLRHQANGLALRAAASPAESAVSSRMIAGDSSVRFLRARGANNECDLQSCVLQNSSKMSGRGGTALAPWASVAGCGPREWRWGAERSIQVHRFDNDPPRLPRLPLAVSSRASVAVTASPVQARELRARTHSSPARKNVKEVCGGVEPYLCSPASPGTAPLSCWRGVFSLVRRPALDRIVSRSSCPNLLDHTPPISSSPPLPN